MITLKKSDSGFGVIEAILILVIVGMVGFTGWYVLQAKKTTDKNLAITNTTAPAVTKKTTTTTESNKDTKPADVSITALGIKLVNVPEALASLTTFARDPQTAVDSNNTTTTPVQMTYVQFSTESLTSADPACSAKDGTSIGLLGRIEGTYVNNGPTEDSSFVKQFNGFYISYSHPQAACSTDATAEALDQSQTAAFQTYATDPDNLQAL